MRRMRSSLSRLPSPQSSTPQLLLMVSRFVAPLVQGVDQHLGDAAEPESAHREGCAIRNVGDGLRRARYDLVNHR